jgi:multidrug efflux system membrane fusion protein
MRRGFLFIALALAALYGAWHFGFIKLPQRQTAEDPRRAMRDMAAPISVAPVVVEDVPVTLDAIGTAQALNSVTVRSQVDGRLIEVVFKEGQDVKAGDVLARIDPSIYQAQYDQAVAKKAQDEATLANARRDLERYARLAADNSGSRQQADTQRTVVAQLEAQVRQDQASIDNAKTYLDFTTIRAPIAGRLGLRLVDAGNLVRASDQTGLVTITQVRPIAIIFTLAQQFLGQVNAALAQGPVVAQALGADNKSVIDKGQVSVVDNQVDPTTGAVKIKATFANDALALWPGQFVNVRLLVSTLQGATVAPAPAVQRGPAGAFVYVVKDDDTVEQVPVTTGLQNERIVVLTTGAQAGMRVATTGFARLTPGAKVRVMQRPAESATGAASPAAPTSAPAQTDTGAQPLRPADKSRGERGRRTGSGSAPAGQ